MNTEYIWKVVGGTFTDTTFSALTGRPESYGPFETREEALAAWKANAFANIDDCHHKLYLIKVEVFEPTNASKVVYEGDSWDHFGKEFRVLKEAARQYRAQDEDGTIVWLPKVHSRIVE